MKQSLSSLTFLLAWAAIAPAHAAPVAAATSMIPAPPQLTAKAWVLMDAASGAVISSQDPDAHLPPASLT